MPLLLRARVDCINCEEPIEGQWGVEDADDPEDIEDVPPVRLTCPFCATIAVYDYPGWQYQTEAG
jgi:hypothetical protein